MKACIETTFTLEEVAKHFERWRSNKRKGERIPEQLWSEAVDLVNSYGVSRVARTLRLGGRDLNNRRGRTEAARNEEATGGDTSFVEMDPVLMDQAVGPESASVWMELERADGIRLRIGGGHGVDLLGVVERFMETR